MTVSLGEPGGVVAALPAVVWSVAALQRCGVPPCGKGRGGAEVAGDDAPRAWVVHGDRGSASDQAIRHSAGR